MGIAECLGIQRVNHITHEPKPILDMLKGRDNEVIVQPVLRIGRFEIRGLKRHVQENSDGSIPGVK